MAASIVGVQVELIEKVRPQYRVGNVGQYQDEGERRHRPRSNEINFCPKVRSEDWFIACKGRKMCGVSRSAVIALISAPESTRRLFFFVTNSMRLLRLASGEVAATTPWPSSFSWSCKVVSARDKHHTMRKRPLLCVLNMVTRTAFSSLFRPTCPS